MTSILLLFVSFIIIWKSADIFVDSSYGIALKLNVSPMVIGATVVAFGTSAPELFVNIFAAYDQDSSIVYGNIIGSNLANTMLILGAASILAPLTLNRSGFQQIYANIFFSISLVFILTNHLVSRFSGLLILIVFLIYYIVMLKRSRPVHEDQPSKKWTNAMLFLLFVSSLISLTLSAKLLVYSLLQTAAFLGISTVFLSLFVVAFATSLPELISSIVFVKKGYSDMLIGNVFGSNLFNFLFVLPLSWFVMPLQLPELLTSELYLLLFLLFLVLLFGYCFKQFNRWLGVPLILMYLSYITFIFLR
tara:strand:- start:4735 stop:5649 length:915 start_codon:yes stop_codon:yes gene_type:complete